MVDFSATNVDFSHLWFAAACNSPIGLPPFGKFSASSEKGGRGSCKAADGYILTHKAWCAKQTNCKQHMQRSLTTALFSERERYRPNIFTAKRNGSFGL